MVVSIMLILQVLTGGIVVTIEVSMASESRSRGGRMGLLTDTESYVEEIRIVNMACVWCSLERCTYQPHVLIIFCASYSNTKLIVSTYNYYY